MASLQANSIQVGYDHNQPAVIDDLSMEIVSGEVVGVIGPNGCGKSTLVRVLSRALRPTRGTVTLDGRDLYRGISARTAARSIAVVPQAAPLSFGFTVREIVRMGRSPHLARHPFASETVEDERIIDAALRDAGITEIADNPATAISGGQWQRTLLARALAQQTQILLLDEPTAHLDILHQIETLTKARDLAHREGRAVLAVLHDLNLAAAFSDRLIMMSEGRIFADGKPETVLTAARIRDVYAADVWIRYDPAMNRPTVLPLPPLDRNLNLPVTGHAPLRIHVICGGGTGAGLLFALSRHGYSVTAGMLTEGDLDAEAARALGIPYVSVRALISPPDDCLAEAKNALNAAPIIILVQMPSNTGNLSVLNWALTASETAKTIICLQQSTNDVTDQDTAGGVDWLWSQIVQRGGMLLHSVDDVLDLLKSFERRGDEGKRGIC